MSETFDLSALDVPAARPVTSYGRRFPTLVEQLPVIVWMADVSGSATDFNARWFEYTGLSRAQSFEQGWEAAVNPDDVAAARGRWSLAIETRTPFEAECRLRGRDGQHRWFLVKAEPLFDARGEVAQWIGTCTDIEQQRGAEEARLLESETRFRAAVEGLIDCFAIYSAVRDEAGRILDFRVEDVNNAACLDHQIPRDQHVGGRLLELLPGHRRSGLFEAYCRVVEIGEPFHSDELRYQAEGEPPRFFEVRASKLGDGVVAAWRDITGRVRAREEAREREEQLRITFDEAPSGIARVGLDGRWIRLNRRYCETLGYSHDELLTRTSQDVTHPDDLEADLEQVRRLLAGDGRTYSMEKRYLRKDGSVVWVNLTVALVRDPEGAPAYFISIIEDISDRKRAEQALKASEAQARALAGELKAVMDAVPAVTFIAHDQGCRQVTSNRAARELMRLPEGANASPSAPEGERPTHFRTLARDRELRPDELPMQVAAATGREVRDFELTLAFDDGTSRVILGNAVPFFDADGRPQGSVGAFLDITEREHAEEALRESEARYRNLFATMSEGFFLGRVLCDDAGTPTDFVIAEINPAFEEQTGLRREQVVGRRAREVLPHVEDYWIDEFGRVALSGQPRRFANYARELDRHFQVMAFSPGPGQVAVLFFNINDQIRTRHALEETGRRLQAILDVLPMPLFLTDASGRVTATNPAARAFWGETPLSRGPADYREDYRAWWPATGKRVEAHEWGMARALATGEQVMAEEMEVETAGGERRIIHNYALPIRDAAGQITGGVSVNVDLTAVRRSGQQLRQTEAHLHALLDSNVIGILFGDVEGGIHDCNEEFARITGYARAEILAGDVRWDAITPPEDLALDQRAIVEARERGAAQPYEKRYVRKDGRVVPVLVGFALIGDEKFRSAAFILDLTDQKEAERRFRESEALFRKVSDANLVGVGFGDAEGRVVYLNDEMLRMMGRSREDHEAGLITWAGTVPPEFAEADAAVLDELRATGQCKGYRQAFHRPDGGRTPFLGAAALMDDGRTLVRLASDLTAIDRAEEALREADRRKDEFLAMLAHELRNPLAAVSSAVQLQQHPGAGPEQVVATRQIIERQTRQLARLVDDLMDVSRISQGKIQLRKEPIDAVPVLRRAVEASQPAMQRKRQAFSASLPSQPVQVQADPARLQQMTVNLLFNASKYTDADGRIDLTADVESGALVIRVRDNGIGIAADMQDRIFEAFTQVDSSLARSQGGLGLGLALVKRLVELHDGTVSVQSAGPDAGSEFTLRIPLPPSPEPAEASGDPHANAADRPEGPLRILVVDDNRDMATSTALLMKLKGHQVTSVHDGHAALDAAHSFRPDVILLDLGLPGMSGYDVAERLRADAAFQSTVLIAISGYAQDRDRARSQAVGIDHHLAKPVEAEHLVSLLARVRPGTGPA